MQQWKMYPRTMAMWLRTRLSRQERRTQLWNEKLFRIRISVEPETFFSQNFVLNFNILYRCTDGRCIKGSQRCDGEYNCDDFSDEEKCNVTCSVEEFKCPNSNVCILNKFKCDGDNDCPNGADEVNCTCPHDHHQCSNGRCIMNRWRCDGWNDCIDGSDETVELCSGISCGEHAVRLVSFGILELLQFFVIYIF